ncbi:putative quinol monooxygenase [Spongisporangium articulatum]|uniref:Quinol monooxygenase n=1 Tax=Spongisporangium articulatum TaxID=3362603 RepID=A0ABW8ASQ2_9ACTN
MLLQRIELAASPGQAAGLESALIEVRQRVFSSPGFRGFTVRQGVERPDVYLVDVLWETPDELLEHGESGRFDRCWAPAQPFLARPPRVDHFTEKPALDLHGPGVITDLAWLGD